METVKERLCRGLRDVDTSLGFLLVLVAAILLSLWSVVIQRAGLCLTLRGETQAAARLPEVFPLKCRSSAMVVGSLGFFLCLALKALCQAEAGEDAAALRSARSNALASALVLAAAVLRWEDLHGAETQAPAPAEEDTLPD